MRIEKSCKIDKSAEIDVKEGYIGRNVQIGKDVSIKADFLYLDEGGIIFPRAIIEGRDIRIGKYFFIDANAVIGGGSCFDVSSYLKAGDFYHQGKNSQVNIGRGIEVGHEFGCGIGTNIFTHGAWLSPFEGFPNKWGSVKIGNRVWLPNALVSPGVKIGNDVVVLPNSVITHNLPSSCMAYGSPAQIKENIYPKILSECEKEKIFKNIYNQAVEIFGKDSGIKNAGKGVYVVQKVKFDLESRTIDGKVTPFSEILRNQLRRNGVRFWYHDVGGTYKKFEETKW